MAVPGTVMDCVSGDDMEEVEVMHQTSDHDGVDVGSYILVKYETQRRSFKYYVGNVELKEGDAIHIKFLRKVEKASGHPSFCFPEKDTDTDAMNDIILILGQLQAIAGTKDHLVKLYMV